LNHTALSTCACNRAAPRVTLHLQRRRAALLPGAVAGVMSGGRLHVGCHAHLHAPLLVLKVVEDGRHVVLEPPV
jgi:hypothetical protein